MLSIWAKFELLGRSHSVRIYKNLISDQLVDFLVNVERYKKTPAHVERMYDGFRPIPVEGKYLIFKRWDCLRERDEPQVVFFFCNPDAIAGLHTLANFDAMIPNGLLHLLTLVAVQLLGLLCEN